VLELGHILFDGRFLGEGPGQHELGFKDGPGGSPSSELGYRKQSDRAERFERLHDLGYSRWPLLFVDVLRERMNYPELKAAVRESAQRYRPLSILIEDKASGTPLIQDLEADGLYAVKGYQPPSGTDKVMRLHLLTALFENGRVLLPRQAPWLAEYIIELTGFPGTKFNDQVDATTHALSYLKEGADNAEAWARFGRSYRSTEIVPATSASTYVSRYQNVFPPFWRRW